MSTEVAAIAIGLVTNVVWALLALTYAKSSTRLRRSAAHQYWGMQGDLSKLAICVSTISAKSTTGEYERRATGWGEVEATAAVSQSLSFANRIDQFPNVSLSSDVSISAFQGPIITVGGSQLNHVSEYFLRAVDLRFIVDNSPPKSVRDLVSGRVYESISEESGLRVDFGIITSIVNPHAPSRRVLILQGAHTFGTAACGRILHPDDVRELAACVRASRGRNWQAVVRATIDGSSVLPALESFGVIGISKVPHEPPLAR